MGVTLDTINIGNLANDGTGDPLRSAFDKINNNFSLLNEAAAFTTTSFSVGNSTQVIFQYPATTFSQGIFQITSRDRGTGEGSQSIVLAAHVTNDFLDVKFVGYGSTISNSPVTTYDMDVNSGNIRILVNPLVTSSLSHFISSQITFIGTPIPGLPIQLDGYGANTLLTTESGTVLETET